MSPIPLLPLALGDIRRRDLLHHAAEGPVDSLDHPPGGGPGPAVGVQGAQPRQRSWSGRRHVFRTGK